MKAKKPGSILLTLAMLFSLSVCMGVPALATEGCYACSDCSGNGYTSLDQITCDCDCKCPECGGTGKGTCPACYGTGEWTCPVCWGTGEGNSCFYCGGAGTEECLACGGTGDFDGSGTCDECGGDGMWSCHLCGGSGKASCENCNNGHDPYCPYCHGTGEYKTTTGTPCTTCNATGYLHDPTHSLAVNVENDGGKYIKFAFSDSTAKRSNSTIADLLKDFSGAVTMNITLTNVPSDLTLSSVGTCDASGN